MDVRRVVAGVLVVAVLAAGCGERHPGHGGRVVAAYPRGRVEPVFGHLKQPAEFILIARQEPPAGSPAAHVRNGWELGRWRLKRRSPLGFKVVNGNLYAVAGRDEVPLPPGAYCWHVRRGSEQIDWGATTLMVVAVASVVFVVSVVYALKDLEDGWLWADSP
jgi:hypothetical protein